MRHHVNTCMPRYRSWYYYGCVSSIRFAAGAGSGESGGGWLCSTLSNGGGALRSELFSSSHLSIASLRLAKGRGPRRLIMSSLQNDVSRGRNIGNMQHTG